MILNLISRSTVKTQLGLSGTTYDASIDAMIPIVSADIRRILNYNFDEYITAIFTSSAATIDLEKINTFTGYPLYQPNFQGFQLGTSVYHPNITQDTYLQSWSPDTGLYTLSSTPSGSGNYIYIGLNIAQFSAVSKMIWYKIGKLSTTGIGKRKTVSESYGGVSKTYAKSEINSQYDYPQVLLDDLGTPYAKVG